MATRQKLKPITGAILELLDNAQATSVARWNLGDIHPLHVSENNGDSLVHAAAVVLDQRGNTVGRLSIDNIPIESWPGSKPTGRPKSTEKHMAVFLAWCLSLHRLGEKKGLADDAAAVMFGYSEGRKVRTIRNKQAIRLGFDLGKTSIQGLYLITDVAPCDDHIDSVVMIGKPAWLPDGDGVVVVGMGYAWHEGMRGRVIQGAIRATVGQVDGGFDLDDARAHGGPIIISSIRPGR